MFVKILLFMAALAAINANPVQSRSAVYESPHYNFTVISVIELEEPCVRQGGTCVRLEDCDPSNLVTVPRSLCPKQRHLGVACCYN